MSDNNVIWQAVAVGAVLRIAFFVGCLRFVGGLLSTDIRQAIDETGDGDDGSGSPIATPTRARTGFNWPPARDGAHASLLPSASPARATGARGSAAGPDKPSYPRLARIVFCLSFAESCTLFTLVVFGDVLNASARTYNWNFSMGSLLTLIVLIVPFGQCLLATYRNKSSSAAISARSLILTLLLFAAYLFCFLQVGDYLSDILGVDAGTNGIGLFANILGRICVPGVILIASLSGFGAVNTAWEAFEWRSMSKKELVTDAVIQNAERALSRARDDLQARRADLQVAENTPVESGARSFFGRVMGTDGASSSMPVRRAASPNVKTIRPAELSALRQEVAGLVAMEAQMVRDLHTLRSRKAALDLAKTWKGKVWSAVGIGFAIYCAVRIVLSVINLTFGYSNAQKERGGAEEDLASQFLRHAIRLTGLNIDAARWSPLINLALIGMIIVANLRSVLAQVSKVLHATSAAVSASFLLLCLAQLMAVYLVTSLVALPATPGSTTAQLLDTLPAFAVFSRLFDGVFLFVALGSLAAKWLERRIRADEPSIIGMDMFGRGDGDRGFV